jgi:cytochrome c oxidase subunit 3
MFFGGLAAAYLLAKSSTSPWPPDGVDLQLYVPVVLMVTLLMSGFTVEWAAYAARRDDRRSLLVALFLTLGFGLAFLNGQWFELRRLGLDVDDHAYDGLFLALAGWHMVHVALGIGLLVFVTLRGLGGQLTPRGGVVRAAAFVWEAIVAVWVVFYWLLYLVK